jgi:hypothetical protein
VSEVPQQHEQPRQQPDTSTERERREQNDASAPPAPGGPGRTDAPAGPLTAGGPAHEEDTTTDTEGQ